MKKHFSKLLLSLSIALLPLLTLSAPAVVDDTRTIEKIFGDVFGIVNNVIVFLMVLATAIFLWGIVKYIMAGGDEEQIKEARYYILWGIIFLGVMVAVWGFVNLLLRFIFGTPEDGKQGIPKGPQVTVPPGL